MRGDSILNKSVSLYILYSNIIIIILKTIQKVCDNHYGLCVAHKIVAFVINPRIQDKDEPESNEVAFAFCIIKISFPSSAPSTTIIVCMCV